MLNNDYLEKLGRMMRNTYNIETPSEYGDFNIGRTVMGMILYLQNEQIRDMRETVNKSQWDEKRMDIIGQNGSTGEHYEA
jgi:hypothetical protein